MFGEQTAAGVGEGYDKRHKVPFQNHFNSLPEAHLQTALLILGVQSKKEETKGNNQVLILLLVVHCDILSHFTRSINSVP